jgi:hypothetical protein
MGESMNELARWLLRDPDAPPVLVLAAAKHLILGDEEPLRELVAQAALRGEDPQADREGGAE